MSNKCSTLSFSQDLVTCKIYKISKQNMHFVQLHQVVRGGGGGGVKYLYTKCIQDSVIIYSFYLFSLTFVVLFVCYFVWFLFSFCDLYWLKQEVNNENTDIAVATVCRCVCNMIQFTLHTATYKPWCGVFTNSIRACVIIS